MCWYCGLPILIEGTIGRSMRCAQCGKDIRSCMNCRLYLPGSRGDCSEPGAQPVPSNRETANFCDWFSLNPKYKQESSGKSKEQDKARAARTAFDDLFK